jgi:hypothetical protein
VISKERGNKYFKRTDKKENSPGKGEEYRLQVSEGANALCGCWP